MIRLLSGDCREVLKQLPDNSIHCCVSSPPYYGLRSYGVGIEGGEIGSESSPEEYLATMVEVYRQVWRVLREDATCWINLGDSYNNFRSQMGPGQALHGRDDLRGKPAPDSRKRGWGGLKEKDLLLMPARLALALQADGWWVRSDIIWHKPNPMPESVRDRPVNSYEHVFLLTKSSRYYFDMAAVAEPAGGTNGAALGGAALAPKPDAAFDADYRAPHLHGRCDLGQPQVTVNCSVAWQAQHTEIVERIRFSIVTEQAERSFVVDLEPGNGVASLAAVAGTLKGCAARNLPIRATIIDAAAAECGASDTDTMDAIPLTDATARAEAVFQPGELLADMVEERRAAEVTFHCDELSQPLLILGTCRPTHRLHDTRNTPTRAIRNVWTIATSPFSAAHFATFPPELAERCIKAGTSERGCCAACGKPWGRETERGELRGPGSENYVLPKAQAAAGDPRNKGRSEGWTPNHFYQPNTTGWAPGCQCDADVKPCVVLDCFAGAGTSLLVADRLQRDAVGIELNTAYTEMAMERCRQDAPLFTSFPPAEPPEDERMADLFTDMAAD